MTHGSTQALPFEMVLSDTSRGVRKVPNGDFQSTGRYPIIDQGNNAIAGYSDEADGLFRDVPAIVFGDHTRCVKYMEQPFLAGADGVKVLVPRRPEDNPKYLYYALRAADIPSLGYSRHFKLVKELSFRMPVRVEQDRIVGRLDRIASEKTLLDLRGEKLDELVKSRFVEMFGDPDTNDKGFETAPGRRLFKLGNGKALPASKRLESGIPAYGGNGVSWYTDEVLVTRDTIVIGRVGRHCGNTRLVKGPMWVTDNAMYIKEFKRDCFDLAFLSRLMSMIGFNRFADEGDLWKISQKPFMEYEFYVPPLALQRDFSSFVSRVDALKSKNQQAIAQLQTLYASLAQEYFGN